MIKTKIISIITMLIILAALPQFQYAGNPRFYWPGQGSTPRIWGEYKPRYQQKDTFYIKWMVMNKNPSVGYPYHSGNTVGVNDTVIVEVYFANQTDDDYYIGSSTPHDWFYPVLYDPYVDVFSTPMLADTSIFDFRFEYWIAGRGEIIAQPDTIYSGPKHGYGRVFRMVYTMWGLAPGTFRVIMEPTVSKPSDVKVLLDDSPNVYTMSTGQDILDTLNSYCTIALNALSRQEMTLFNTYVGNIFTLDPKSVPGWALRYHGYKSLADTVNALMALDSLFYNIENRLDPQIPDSSNMTPVHGAWLKQWAQDYGRLRERMLNPDYWRYRISF